MTINLDTSVLVAALTAEPATPRIQDWLTEQSGQELAISPWVVAEFSSALSIKRRNGHLDAASRERAVMAFRTLADAHLVMLDIRAVHFHAAARMTDRHELGLRAGDALHLAICADHEAAICTLDRRIGTSGPSVGVRTIVP